MAGKLQIDLNRADKDQLLNIRGVDEELASRIIAHRKKHGSFRTMAELDALGPMPADAAEALRTEGCILAEPTAEMRASEGGAFTLTSPAFEDGQPIPKAYTADGEGHAPPLKWTGAPPGTKSFALIMEDPDAPQGVFRHWALYEIAPERTELPEGVGHGAKTERLGHGVNDFGAPRYDGPSPPQGHAAHRYYFRLAALSVPTIQVPDHPSVEDVWRAAEPYVISQAELVGTYGR